jgi:hypothetical protein
MLVPRLSRKQEMAWTVSAAFDTFFNNINLGGDHRDTANGRRDSIIDYLKNDFEILDALATGSIPKFTALRARSDVDVMVVLHYSKHLKGKLPAEVIQSVRDALSAYRTNVRKNGQAVTLHYKTWPNVDVVPAAKVEQNGTLSYYLIPDANNNKWIKTKPKHFADEIEKRSTECGYNFRRIIKMIKRWSAHHGDYLTSYHIEVLALKVLFGNLDETPWQVYQCFERMNKLLPSQLYGSSVF